MTNAKTLILAAAAALTLGAGSAMAQSQAAGGAGDFWQIPSLNQPPRIDEGRVQAGSSDLGRNGSHTLPFNGAFGDLANPG
jgi:hypothetical protein